MTARPLVLVCVLLVLTLGLVACGDSGGPHGPPLDTGADVADTGDTADAPDTEGDAQADAPDALDAADADVGEPDVPVDPGVVEGSVTVDDTTLTLSFDPFALSLTRGGETVVADASRAEVAFSGLAIALDPNYSRNRWYDPTLSQRDIDRKVVWYRAHSVRQGVEDSGGYIFTVRTRDADDTPGPDITVRLSAAEHSVQLDVACDDETHVFTNLALDAGADEGFYGFGEQFDRLDARGHIRDMQIQARGESESGVNEVHVSVHLMLSTRRYFVFLDDRAPAAFDLAATHDDAVRVTTASRDAAFHFVTEQTPIELVETYSDITGRPAQVPHWALAPQWWRNVSDREEVLDDARRSREMGFPSSVLWIDRPWSSYYHNWRFNAELYPEAEAMFDELRALGYRVVLHHSPQMSPPGTTDLPLEDASEGLYQEFAENGWFVTNEQGSVIQFPWGGGSGAFVDYSHPDAVEAVTGHIQRVTDLGAVGTKMDWDEYLQPNVQTVRLHLLFHNGESNFTMRQWYSALYHKTIIEAFNQHLGTQSFHVARSGVQRDQVWSTCIWPGDLDNDFSEHTRGPSEMQEEWNVGGLPAAIVANQSLGMSGYPCFASDIGGYRGGTPDEEVLVRWLGFGVFNGVMQLGGSRGPHMPWATDSPFSETAFDVAHKFFRLRMDLVPYAFQQFVRAHNEGTPVVRSMWMQYPDDPAARAFERDFHFGPDLLVAPIYTPSTTQRTHYVPAGRFVDWWTGETVEGPMERTVAAPLDSLPILVREGAIIPMAAPDIDTMWPEEDDDIVGYAERSEMRLYIAPAPGAQASFYNGVSAVVGETSRSVAVTVGEPDPSLDPAMAFAPDRVGLQLVAEAEPAAVLVDGQACEGCWEWDAARRLVVVAPLPVPYTAELVDD